MQDTTQLTDQAQKGDPKAQFLLAGQLFNSGQFDQAWDWLEKSVAQGFPPARHQKGILLGLGQNCDEDPELALEIFHQLAEEGYPDAMRTLANLYSCGVIAGDDWVGAKDWFVKAFMKGHIGVITEAAILMKICGVEQKLWVPLLAKAAENGEAKAKHYLEAEGPGVGQLAGALDFTAVLSVLNNLPKPDIGSGEIVFERPETHTYKGIFSNFETDYLMTTATPHLNPAIVYNTDDLKEEKSPVRTNMSSTFHFPKQDFVVNYLGRKMVAMSGEPLENAEHLVVLKYLQEEEYLPHFDHLDPAVPALKKEVERNGQRIKTALVYLNDDYVGGETEFVHIDAKVKGDKGQGLLFHNVLPNGDICKESQHAGCAIESGIKWLAVKWIRSKPMKRFA